MANRFIYSLPARRQRDQLIVTTKSLNNNKIITNQAQWACRKLARVLRKTRQEKNERTMATLWDLSPLEKVFRPTFGPNGKRYVADS